MSVCVSNAVNPFHIDILTIYILFDRCHARHLLITYLLIILCLCVVYSCTVCVQTNKQTNRLIRAFRTFSVVISFKCFSHFLFPLFIINCQSFSSLCHSLSLSNNASSSIKLEHIHTSIYIIASNISANTDYRDCQTLANPPNTNNKIFIFTLIL